MAKEKAIAKGATELVKYISEFGKTATVGKYGSGKNGIGQLSDEQLERGVNRFKAKKAEKKEKAKPKPKPKAKPKSPKRDVTKSATQKGLRLKDKPDVNIEVESDASRSVDETNLIRGARSAGRSTNQPGRTNIGSMSMANFIKDASKNYGVVQKRKKIDAEFQRRINLAETPAQKKKLKDALKKLQDQRAEKDKADLKATGRKISKSLQGKKRSKPMSKKDIALKAIMPDPKTGEGGGELVPEFFELNKNLQDQLMRSAEATLKRPEMRRLEALREKGALKRGDAPQLERGEAITVPADISKKAQDTALKALQLVGYTAKRAKQIINQKLAKAKSVREFTVEIRSMVDKAKGKAGNKPGDIGAVVRGRGSSIDDASPNRGRKMNKGGVAKKKVPVITIGIGMAKMPKGKKPRKGNMDFRNGGMVTGTSNNLKPVPSGNKGKGLRNLPTPVRNKMGFMKKGGMVKK